MSALLSARVIFRTWQTPLLKSLKIQNTQEIKRTLFYSTKQDKTCKFSRKSSFSTFLSCFVQLKSVLLISCVFWIFFSEHLQSTLFQIFFFSSFCLALVEDVIGAFFNSLSVLETARWALKPVNKLGVQSRPCPLLLCNIPSSSLVLTYEI